VAVELKDRKRATTGLKSWLDDIAAYERKYKKWEGRVEKILKRYRDDNRSMTDSNRARFNVLWSNVQTLTAATFAKIPKPDVSRRFRDNDPVGRVASLILERGLDFHIQHYAAYRTTLKADVLDRFLGGRGCAWVRYEPHYKQPDLPDGYEVTEDVDEPNEVLDYECVAVDYVHWKDFGHSVARTWEEVPRVWRAVYLTKEALEERFGEKIARMIPMDASPTEVKGSTDYRPGDAMDRAKVYEGWDKNEKCAVWFSKGVKDFLDQRDDPLGLEEFFPCPRPLFATLTNDSLEPIPDFTLYQDQANELDILCDRIDGLVKALQVKGVYDASIGALGRIFTEGENNTLIPVKNWQAFAEKNGLKGAIDLVDIAPIAKCLIDAYQAMDQVKGQIYEITGISDIVRGQTEASETATAQQIKGQYASLRLKTYQESVAQFATELLQIMAQIMCGKFAPKTLLAISAADQLSEHDQQLIPQAMALLVGEQRMQVPESPASDEIPGGPNPLRQFRVEVAADTLVYMDEQAEKESRMEFLTANAGFLQNMVGAMQQAGPAAPALVPLLMEIWKFGVGGFRIGKTIEGAFDEAAEQVKAILSQPPQPQPDPKLETAKLEAQTQAQVVPIRAQAEAAKAQADIAGSQAAVIVASEKTRQAHLQAAMPPMPMVRQ
jgi:hypothetical protein